MSAPLSHADLARLPSVLGTMLTPHAHADARAWGDALCGELAALLPDAMIGLLRMTPQGPYTHTPLPLEDQVLYVRHWAHLDPASRLQSARRLPVAHRWSLTRRDEVLGTPYHEEWLRPRRLADAFWLNTFDGAGTRHRIFLNFDTVQEGADRERVLTLLRLLAPAFESATDALDRMGDRRTALHDALDALAQPAQLCDAAGRVLHRTAALGALLAAEPERLRVEAELGAAARDVARAAAGRPGADVGCGAARTVVTARARYTVRGTLAPAGAPTSHAVLLTVSGGAPVAATPAAPAGPGDDALRERYGLTPREAAVARLLAERLTDAEIGARLGTSPNTARTHVERVRAKLCVARRTDVAAALAALRS